MNPLLFLFLTIIPLICCAMKEEPTELTESKDAILAVDPRVIRTKNINPKDMAIFRSTCIKGSWGVKEAADIIYVEEDGYFKPGPWNSTGLLSAEPPYESCAVKKGFNGYCDPKRIDSSSVQIGYFKTLSDETAGKKELTPNFIQLARDIKDVQKEKGNPLIVRAIRIDSGMASSEYKKHTEKVPANKVLRSKRSIVAKSVNGIPVCCAFFGLLYDISTEELFIKPASKMSSPIPVDAFAWSPTQDVLAIQPYDLSDHPFMVCGYVAKEGKTEIKSITLPTENRIVDFDWHPDGQQLFCVEGMNIAAYKALLTKDDFSCNKLYALQSSSLPNIDPAVTMRYRSVACSPDGACVLVGEGASKPEEKEEKPSAVSVRLLAFDVRK